MGITREEIEEILANVEDGNKVLEYIEEHYCHCHDEGHKHDKDEHCNCHDDEHHHEHHCDCGCEDDHDDEWKELDPKGYKSKLSVEDWEELLKNKELFSEDSLIIMTCLGKLIIALIFFVILFTLLLFSFVEFSLSILFYFVCSFLS